jgi:hypothetical protein
MIFYVTLYLRAMIDLTGEIEWAELSVVLCDGNLTFLSLSRTAFLAALLRLGGGVRQFGVPSFSDNCLGRNEKHRIS